MHTLIMTIQAYEPTTRFGRVITQKAAMFRGDLREFNCDDLCPNCITHYNRGLLRRIKVRWLADGSEQWGTLGITTGWKPCFMLLANRASKGSANLLTPGTFQIVDAKDLPR